MSWDIRRCDVNVCGLHLGALMIAPIAQFHAEHAANADGILQQLAPYQQHRMSANTWARMQEGLAAIAAAHGVQTPPASPESASGSVVCQAAPAPGVDWAHYNSLDDYDRLISMTEEEAEQQLKALEEELGGETIEESIEALRRLNEEDSQAQGEEPQGEGRVATLAAAQGVQPPPAAPGSVVCQGGEPQGEAPGSASGSVVRAAATAPAEQPPAKMGRFHAPKEAPPPARPLPATVLPSPEQPKERRHRPPSGSSMLWLSQ